MRAFGNWLGLTLLSTDLFRQHRVVPFLMPRCSTLAVSTILRHKLSLGAESAPTAFCAVRISNRLPWIQNIVFPGTPLPSPAPTPRLTPSPIGTPPSGLAQMLSPIPGATLSSSVITFNWTAGGTATYWLFVGTSPGTSNIYTSGPLNVNSITVGNLPKDGSTICVRLTSVVRKGKRQSVDYTYRAYGPVSTPGQPGSAANARDLFAEPTPRRAPRSQVALNVLYGNYNDRRRQVSGSL